jgi:hypothetical protein
MGRRKVIRCISYSPFTVYPKAEEPWDDVWVSWKERPGRPRRKYGPTLIARADVRGEVEKYEFLIPLYSKGGSSENAEMEEFAREELPKAREMLAQLDWSEFIIDRDPKEKIPNLYTRQEWLTRETAEELLAVWLREVHGIRNPKFEWDHPKIFVRSI